MSDLSARLRALADIGVREQWPPDEWRAALRALLAEDETPHPGCCLPSLGEPCGRCHRCTEPANSDEAEAEFHCERCGSDSHDTMVCEDTPVPAARFYTDAQLVERERAAEARALREFVRWVATQRAYNGSTYDYGQSLYNECLNAALPGWAEAYLRDRADRIGGES